MRTSNPFPLPPPLPPHPPGTAPWPQLIKQKGFLRTQRSLEPRVSQQPRHPRWLWARDHRSHEDVPPSVQVVLTVPCSGPRAPPPEPPVTPHTPTDTHFLRTYTSASSEVSGEPTVDQKSSHLCRCEPLQGPPGHRVLCPPLCGPGHSGQQEALLASRSRWYIYLQALSTLALPPGPAIQTGESGFDSPGINCFPIHLQGL